MENDLNPYAAPSSSGAIVRPPVNPLSERLRLTSLGLRLIFSGGVTTLIAWLAALVVVTVGDRGWGSATYILAVIAMSGLGVVNFGPVLCLTVPSGYGLRPFVAATVLLQAIGIFAFIATFLRRGMFANSLVLVFAVFAASMFLFFVYRLAQCLGRDDLVRRTRLVAMLWSIVVFCFLPLNYISNRVSMELGFMMWIGYLAGTLITLLSYAMLTNAVGNAIRASEQPLAAKR